MSQPRIPLNVQKMLHDQQQSDIQKSQGQGTHVPNAVLDWVADHSVNGADLPNEQRGQYRVDVNRVSGNQVFRRYHDGTLDIENAKNVIVDVVEKAKGGVWPLTDLDRLILSVAFPSVFNFEDPFLAAKIRTAQVNLSEDEVRLVAAKVALHFHQVMATTNSTLGTGA